MLYVFWFIGLASIAQNTPEKNQSKFGATQVIDCDFYRFPLPTRYVFVPCNVIGPGLQPNIRYKFDVNFVITGIGVSFAALIV